MLEIVQLIIIGIFLAGLGAMIVSRIRQRWLLPAILLWLFAPAIPMALVLALGTLGSPAPGSGTYNLAFGVMLIGAIILVPWIIVTGIGVAIGLKLRRRHPPEPLAPPPVSRPAVPMMAPPPPSVAPPSSPPPSRAAADGPTPHFSQTSPDGSIRVDIEPVEWANSQFVHTPRVIETARNLVLCDLLGTDWEANTAFPRDRYVWLGLRRFRTRGYLFADFDLDANRYRIALGSLENPDEEGPLGDISDRLEAWWQRATAIAPVELTKEGPNPPTPGPFAAWRTALVILIGTIAAIAGLTWWSVTYNVDVPDVPVIAHIPRMPR